MLSFKSYLGKTKRTNFWSPDLAWLILSFVFDSVGGKGAKSIASGNIFEESFTFSHSFPSPQVNWNYIIITRTWMYQLPCDLRLRIWKDKDKDIKGNFKTEGRHSLLLSVLSWSKNQPAELKNCKRKIICWNTGRRFNFTRFRTLFSNIFLMISY